MGFMDELKKLARPYSEEEPDDFDDYDDEEEYEDEEVQEPAPSRVRNVRNTEKTSAPTEQRRIMNVTGSSQLQVVLVKPERFDAVSEIADRLRERCAVVLNLESANKDVARRLVDFLSGCAYALDGKIKKVAVSTYLITPYNVDIIGDLVEELENTGMYF